MKSKELVVYCKLQESKTQCGFNKRFFFFFFLPWAKRRRKAKLLLLHASQLATRSFLSFLIMFSSFCTTLISLHNNIDHQCTFCGPPGLVCSSNPISKLLLQGDDSFPHWLTVDADDDLQNRASGRGRPVLMNLWLVWPQRVLPPSST